MSTFDAPILGCQYCGEYVLRDQTSADCARDHGCDLPECPLAEFFMPCVEPKHSGPGSGHEPDR